MNKNIKININIIDLKTETLISIVSDLKKALWEESGWTKYYKDKQRQLIKDIENEIYIRLEEENNEKY